VTRQAIDDLKRQIPLMAYLEAQDCRPRRALSRGRWMGLCPLHEDRKPAFSSILTMICSTVTGAAVAAISSVSSNSTIGSTSLRPWLRCLAGTTTLRSFAPLPISITFSYSVTVKVQSTYTGAVSVPRK
jgi:hypothetical protein